MKLPRWSENGHMTLRGGFLGMKKSLRESDGFRRRQQLAAVSDHLGYAGCEWPRVTSSNDRESSNPETAPAVEWSWQLTPIWATRGDVAIHR